MLRIAVLLAGGVWIAFRLIGYATGLAEALSRGDLDLASDLGAQAIREGLFVLALFAIIGVVEGPGVVRTWRVRRANPDSLVFLARANPELRRLLMTHGHELSIANGDFKPRILFTVTVGVDDSGMRFWSSASKPVGVLGFDKIKQLGVGARLEGFYRVPGLELNSTAGDSATFLVVDDRPPLFLFLPRKSIAELVDKLRQLLRAGMDASL